MPLWNARRLMPKKPRKQHVFNPETDLCIYCGADLQEGQLPCDRAPDSAPDYDENDKQRRPDKP